MKNYRLFPFSRIRKSFLDVLTLTERKHHVPFFLECDVTVSLQKLKVRKDNSENISFTSWLIKVVGAIIAKHRDVAAFVYNDKNFIIFDEVKMLVMVEKNLNGCLMPLGLLIDQPDKMTIPEIKKHLKKAQGKEIRANDLLLNSPSGFFETVYLSLPAFLRRSIWKVMLWYPRIAHAKMGNVLFSSIGMVGQIKGWFVHRSIHPISFGIGSVLKKPVVIDDEIKIRDILNVTILLDHDVLDGAPMTRFLLEFVEWVESGYGL